MRKPFEPPSIENLQNAAVPRRRRRPKPRDSVPPRQALDPMPARIEPCLATLVGKPPVGPQWVFEVKWDGYRLAIHIEPGRLRILTRGEHDWTARFPSIAAEARNLPLQTAILDGEAVILDEKGRSDFGMLQRALKRRPAAHEPEEIILYAFDLLYLDGCDLRRLPQRERRRLLQSVLAGRNGPIRLSEEVEAEGSRFFSVACELGLEGIIAKDREMPYRTGRRPEWLKVKCVRRDNFVIVGFEPSTVPGAIGRLLLAAMKGGSPVYVGGVGTGFTRQSSAMLRELLEQIPTKTPAVKLGRKNAIFTRPILAAEIEYRAWTDDRKLRHPSFKGLHEINDVATIYRIDQ
ncbi:non-homologous end-joining DNA ligase [Rhizobium giardinii]|uniref:non-homologous end-joining DNA ligase n=1 Tax=Rhizobium giardinii TaxID=56731 RepID=UPI0039DF53D2